MGKNINIEFYFKSGSVTKDLLKIFINTVLKNGFRPSSNFHYGTYNKFRDVKFGDVHTQNPEGAIDAIYENGSVIDYIYQFIYKDIIYFSLYIAKSGSEEKQKADKITISIEAPGFDDHNKNKDVLKERIKECQAVIEVAKIVWNSLKLTPIYGIGHDEVYWNEVENGVPTDENIINLNVENNPYPLNAYWLNFYGPGIIKKYGREKILSGYFDPKAKRPPWKMEKLKDGILIIMSPLPETFYLWPEGCKFLSKKELNARGIKLWGRNI